MPIARKSSEHWDAENLPTAALTVTLLTNSFLRTVAAYTARAGAVAALFSIPVLVLVSGCFLLCWRLSSCPFLRVLWAALLFFFSVSEILRIAVFLQSVYPGTVTPVLCGFLLLLPVIYLRQNIVLVQIGRILLWILIGGVCLLVASIFSKLHFEHLQIIPITVSTVFTAGRAQVPLYPEYLLPTLWLNRCDKPKGQSIKYACFLPLLGVCIDVLVHFVLELFFGAAAFERTMPLYTAACSGAFSVFERLEWFQVFLWCSAAALRLALYFTGAVRLLRGPQIAHEAKSIPLTNLLYYGSALLFFCVLFKDNAALLTSVCAGGMWAVAAFTMIGGAAAWLCQKATGSF